MKIAEIRKVRSQMASLLGGDEPVLITRHGKISGLYLPLDQPDRIPDNLRRELAGVLGRYLDQALRARGVTEEDVQEDFNAHRRRLPRAHCRVGELRTSPAA